MRTGEDDLSTPVALAAQGALHADFGENAVELGFERSKEAAARIARDGRVLEDRVAKAVGGKANVDERVWAEGNTVIWWDEVPTHEKKETLTDCLKEAS